MKLLMIILSLVVLFVGCTEPRYDNPMDPLVEDGGGQQYYEEITHTPMGSYGGSLGSDDIELRVEWAGNANRVIWYKGNNQHWIDTDVSDNSSILRFDNLQHSDTGYYSYEVDFQEMGLTGRSQGYRVYVEGFSGEQPTISVPDYVYVGDQVTLSVNHVFGKTVEWIQWYFNDNPAGTSNDIYIGSVDEGHEGTYFCIVKYMEDGSSVRSEDKYMQVDVKDNSGTLAFSKSLEDGLSEQFVDGAFEVYRSVEGELRMSVDVYRPTSLSNVKIKWLVSSDNGNTWSDAALMADVSINDLGKECLVSPLKLFHSGKMFKCQITGTFLNTGDDFLESKNIRLFVSDMAM